MTSPIILHISLPMQQSLDAAKERRIDCAYVRSHHGESQLVASMAQFDLILAWWLQGTTLRCTTKGVS